MRLYLSEPPRWVLAVLFGIPFGIGMGIVVKRDASTWAEAGIGALVMGVAFGLGMGFATDKWLRTMRAAEGHLKREKVPSAHRAAQRGPVPDDPEVRAAALRIATQQLDLDRRAPLLVIIPAALLLVGVVAASVTESPWHLLFAVVPGLMLFGRWYRPRQLRRRVALLSGSDHRDR
ncbi:MAG TPA: hypothetical protein VGD15_08260 [Kribbella sp.]|jgi:Flp pilus assembly protein TadB